ncbi:MAG TPA: hypothetical protein VNL74_09380 [Methylococcus sp.]|nr:hypothetical protein [Methylococcus sp.]
MESEQTEPKGMPPFEEVRLSNGRYTVLIDAAGSGASFCDGLALTRWSGDRVEDEEGWFVYLRDRDSGRFWSLGLQPCGKDGGERRAGHRSDVFRLECHEAEIAAVLEVAVMSGETAELRRLSLSNRSHVRRRLEVTSYLEVVLHHPAADSAHPAFAKLFVQTDVVDGVLLARRRPRAVEEHWPWLVHALYGPGKLQWETDRKRFLGRGRSRAAPAALVAREELTGTVGNVLDPVLSLRRTVELAVGETAEWWWLLGTAPNREDSLALARRFDDPERRRDAWFEVEKKGRGREERMQSFRRVGPVRTPTLPPAVSASPPCGMEETGSLHYDNGYGGFAEEGREYRIRLVWRDGILRRPPLPWVNVIAQEKFGFLVSESGASCTWGLNSREFRLTPWYNDPVLDPHSEAFYLRDESTGLSWSPLPGPRPGAGAYECCHGWGYTRFHHSSRELEQETLWFVPPGETLKIVWLRITNRGAARKLSVYRYQRLVLGSSWEQARGVVTRYEERDRLLLAVNPLAGEFADQWAFAAVVAPECGYQFTCDRARFLGPCGSPERPAALSGEPLDGASGAGLDPCFAERLIFEVQPGATAEVAFLLGSAASAAEAAALVAKYRPAGAVEHAFQETCEFWRRNTDALRIETPVPALNFLLNGWLFYQNLSCRLWGRSAFYQSGGAYGFRDQLQDAAALVYQRPDLTRRQILLHAAHQFVEGDVLHWWHPEPIEKGLRTRFSDDLLWLPYVTAHYVRTTGDWNLLSEEVRFLAARRLAEGEDEDYLTPTDSGIRAEVYEHCCRAIDRSLTRGAHGLPLMGTGDWNDGMNRVGREGKGESVWLGFFLSHVLDLFAPLCEARGDTDRVQRYRGYQEELKTALNAAGWDGEWYRRAYYDDGTPLGTRADSECRIDALAQAWAVISGVAPVERAAQAMDAVERELIQDEPCLIRLLAPPFVDTPHDPGYIKGYVAGVRENGGQYTHAACWVVRAMAELGRHERATALLTLLNPVRHGDSPEKVEVYQVEPYVVAADVYGVEPHVGRGGWTWYTGSAGWFHRVALETILGFTLEEGRYIRLEPRIPESWPGYRIVYRFPEHGTRYDLRVEHVRPGGAAGLVLDGVSLPCEERVARIPIQPDSGLHTVVFRLGI